MTTVQSHPLVEEYLRRLETAAAQLPAARRAELVAEIGEHIDAALREWGSSDEVAVRNVLERLGSPDEIAAVAAGPPPPGPSRESAMSRNWDVLALVALVVPFLGWLVGGVLVGISSAWSSREKALGLAIVVVSILIPLVGFVAAGGPDGTPVPVGTPEEPPTEDGGDTVAIPLLVAPGVLAALYLGWRLRRKAV